MKTIVPGNVITSLDQLQKCEFIIVRGKPLHKGWFYSWPLRSAMRYIEQGLAFEGIKVSDEVKEDA